MGVDIFFLFYYYFFSTKISQGASKYCYIQWSEHLLPTESLSTHAITYEIPIRVGAFAAIFICMFAFEMLSPRRRLTTSKMHRWFNKLSIHILNTIMIRALFPVIPITMAILAAEK